jgi:hypothetical protein
MYNEQTGGNLQVARACNCGYDNLLVSASWGILDPKMVRHSQMI